MIDHNTVQQILDAADIVDVVSDFVSLKKRGANWIGLCPFHNDRRPSFYVSRAKGICKCFACGEGGSAVNFIMKHEQLSYPEALRYLARKYHIEIQEKELTDEEKQAQSEREAMLMLNEWACAYFEKQLHETQAGQEIGLAYFKERGFNDATIKEFRLGYSSEGYDDLYKAAIAQGFNPKLLFDVGLCLPDDHGGHDRFRGRVMFPIMNIAGKVIAFGGRTLRKDKEVAKYVNSPESSIYSKRNVIYGLHQAKREISKEDKCFIVEGYADVISMHQAGFKNVIASSGTALTEGHIHAIRRFTSNVTEMFDGDAAGIKAAIRGVDMLLKEGLNIKVLPLPPEDDPDTFVRAHSHTEVEDYIKQNECDFINFKSGVVLNDAQNDPIKRSAAITDVVKSIALIPDEIARMVYAKECSNLFGFDEQTILRQIKQHRNKYIEQWHKERQQQQAREQRQAAQQAGGKSPAQQPEPQYDTPTLPPTLDDFVESDSTHGNGADNRDIAAHNGVDIQEREVIRLIVNYGMCYLTDTQYDDETVRPTTVLEYINNELLMDQMDFSNRLYKRTFEIAKRFIDPYYRDLASFNSQLEKDTRDFISQEMVQTDDQEPLELDSHSLIVAQENKEKSIQAKANATAMKKLMDFSSSYLMKLLCSIDDDQVRQLACELATDNLPQLSKIHTKYTVIVEERDRLLSIVPERLYNWKNALLIIKINEVKAQIASAAADQLPQLLEHLQELYSVRHQLAAIIGDRVVNPN
ncbi:MAG: DNA primase [Muribaculaceae bacterium]|nr:DNA primase [Muribaculaceae bacterium]